MGVQKFVICGEEMKARIIIQCKVKIDNEYWFAAGNTNGLFKKNLSTEAVEFIDFFPEEEITLFRAYTDAHFINNKIIFTPGYAKKIAVYDVRERKFLDIHMPIIEKVANKYMKSVLYNSYVYFTPFLASAFMKYNVHQNKVEILENWNAIRDRYINQDTNSSIITEVCFHRNYLFMFLNNQNKVIILDMDLDEFSVRELGGLNNENICSACEYNGSIWLVTDKCKIYKWDYLTDKIKQVFMLSDYVDYPVKEAICSCATENKIYIRNEYCTEIVVFDHISNTGMVVDISRYISPKSDNLCSLYILFDMQRIDKNKIQLYSFYDGKYLIVDGNKILDSYSGFFIPKRYFDECFIHGIITEEQLMTMGLGIKDINILLQNIGRKGEKYKGNIGTAIYWSMIESSSR